MSNRTKRSSASSIKYNYSDESDDASNDEEEVEFDDQPKSRKLKKKEEPLKSKKPPAPSRNGKTTKSNKRKLDVESDVEDEESSVSESDELDEDVESDDSNSRKVSQKRNSGVKSSSKRKIDNNGDSDDAKPAVVKKKRTVRKKVVESDEEGEDSDDDEDEDNNDENGDGNEAPDENDLSEDEGEDEDDTEKPDKKAAKRRSQTSKVESSDKKKSQRSIKNERDTAAPKTKRLNKLERLEEARQAFKWWEAEELPDGINWKHLEHTGVVFPPSYECHYVPLLYNNHPVKLTAEQEEMATFYAAIPEDGPQLGNKKTRPVFQKNFFEEFSNMLPAGHEIKKFELCDFSRIRDHLNVMKELRKAATQDEKLAKKVDKDLEMQRQGFALIDGRIEKMGNFRMEPPGLFRGRGEHPKTGCLKARVMPESVTLNLSVDSCPPICELPGHSWQAIKHDPSVTWLCTWQENVQNQYKYVMLAASSSFKGKSDMEKYSKAILLHKHINHVRQDYTKKIKSADLAQKQLGTAMWVIDKLALRVGGEKGEDEADTVGCCSLRVEHLTFNPTPNTFEIELEFLGKDSMLYKQNINYATYGDLGTQVYRNLKSFCTGKKRDQDVFETLNPSLLNKHLNSLMPGLSAKVFRTYNASITLEQELPSAGDLVGLTVPEKVIRYNAANRSVAILCNHQKTVSKAAEVMFENLNDKLETLKSQRAELIKWRDLVHKGKSSQIPRKDDDKSSVDVIAQLVKDANRLKETATTTEEKLRATAAVDDAKKKQKEDQKRRFNEKHMYKTGSNPSEEDISNRISKWNQDIRKLEVDIRNRDENKEVALGTSKINYMDPRITVAWCKRCEVPIDKVFARTLRDKFNWAMAVPPDWKFTH